MTTQVRPSRPTAIEPYRFTVEQYYAMAQAGILKKDDRVELIDGVVVAMAPIGNRHMAAVDKYNVLFVEALGRRGIVRVQGSVMLGPRTLPEPDLAILRPRDDFYSSRAAGPNDVLLIVEVSDSSVEYDRGEKLALYARHNIPEVWLTILPERIIEAHTEPVGGRYTQMRVYSPGESISPGEFTDVKLPVNRIIPD